jgi:hypothetical protein
MRLVFPDNLNSPASDVEGERMLREARDWFATHSYGSLDLVGMLSPNLLMPRPATYYVTNRAFSILFDDAIKVATHEGLSPSAYDFSPLLFNRIFEEEGFAFPGTKMTFLQSTHSAHLIHELGHNLGLIHANAWKTTDGSIIGSGRNEEYGNFFDMMGQGELKYHTLNAWEKHTLGWLPDSFVQTITTSGVFRLRALDASQLTPNSIYALKVGKDVERDYWIEWHARAPDLWIRNGVLINWSPWSDSNNGTQLLDMTPESIAGLLDPALLPGITFSDNLSGVHVTLLSPVPGKTDEIELRVNLGSFPGNRAPSVTLLPVGPIVATNSLLAFTADASDPDGDDLAFNWDFYDLREHQQFPSVEELGSTWALRSHLPGQ